MRFAYATNGQAIYGIDMETGAEGERGRLSDARRAVGADLRRSRTPGATASPPCRSRTRAAPGRRATTRTSPSTRVLEAIADGQDRILLTLATGTGKTFIAFQIAWKLFQSRWNLTTGTSGASRRAGRASCSWPTATSSPTRPTTPSPPSPDDALVRIDAGRDPQEGQACRRTAASSSPSSRPS